MPLPTQHSLLCILLFWTTVISIIQAVFIILFFTLGHKDLLQNNSITESPPLKSSQVHSTPSPPLKDKLHSCGGMSTFKATGGSSTTITWLTKIPCLIIETQPSTTLTFVKGGYYFLNLQVTLSEYGNPKVKRTVHLSMNENVILEGWFNTNTNSTGLLSKVEKLSTGSALKVTINPPCSLNTCSLNTSESVTHLDIIYLPLNSN